MEPLNIFYSHFDAAPDFNGLRNLIRKYNHITDFQRSNPYSLIGRICSWTRSRLNHVINVSHALLLSVSSFLQLPPIHPADIGAAIHPAEPTNPAFAFRPLEVTPSR
jgi:hypothetical protein